MERKDIYFVEYTASFEEPVKTTLPFYEHLVGNHDIAGRIGSEITGTILPETVKSKLSLSGVYFDEKHTYEHSNFDVYRVVLMDGSREFEWPKEVKTLFYIIASYPAEVHQIIRENPELQKLVERKDPLLFYDVKVEKWNIKF